MIPVLPFLSMGSLKVSVTLVLTDTFLAAVVLSKVYGEGSVAMMYGGG